MIPESYRGSIDCNIMGFAWMSTAGSRVRLVYV
jgi:hypothetical protein